MDSDDPVEVIKFLRTVPAKKLVALENHIYTEWVNCNFFFQDKSSFHT